MIIQHVIHLVQHHSFAFAISWEQFINWVAVNCTFPKVNLIVKLKLFTQHVIRKDESKLSFLVFKAEVMPKKNDYESLTHPCWDLHSTIFVLI